MTLAKSGFFVGNPQTVLEARVDLVMHAYAYEIFSREYESTSIEMNKKD